MKTEGRTTLSDEEWKVFQATCQEVQGKLGPNPYLMNFEQVGIAVQSGMVASATPAQ